MNLLYFIHIMCLKLCIFKKNTGDVITLFKNYEILNISSMVLSNFVQVETLLETSASIEIFMSSITADIFINLCKFFDKLWFMSLERHKPFASRKHANGLCRSRDVNHLLVFFLPANGSSFSIVMGDINHLMVNVCKGFTSLYCYEGRKPYACHIKNKSKKKSELFNWDIKIIQFEIVEVFHLNIFFFDILQINML